MATWAEFETASPDLAAFGERQLQMGLGYLATVRRDGSPRLHPITPVVTSGHLLVRMEPSSPKGPDLRREPRYALHSTVADPEGECREFAVRGHAREVQDPRTRRLAPPEGTYTLLFELLVGSALGTSHREGRPVRRRWAERS